MYDTDPCSSNATTMSSSTMSAGGSDDPHRPDIVNAAFFSRVLSAARPDLSLDSFAASEDDPATVGGANSQLVAVRIRAKAKHGSSPEPEPEPELINLMVKMNRKEADAFENLIGSYQREKGCYTQILALIPAMISVSSSSFSRPASVPVHFFDDDSETIVMEDVTKTGWTHARNRLKGAHLTVTLSCCCCHFAVVPGLDLKHCQLVMDWLAKFHAFSHLIMTRERRNCHGVVDDDDVGMRRRKSDWVDSRHRWARSAYGFPPEALERAEDRPEYQAALRERMLEEIKVRAVGVRSLSSTYYTIRDS